MPAAPKLNNGWLNSLATLYKHRGVQVILLVVLYLFAAPHLPLELHQGLYTLSLLLKDLLVWMLPLTACFFIASAVCGFRQRAPLFILSLLAFEGLSNLVSVWYAYAGGHLASASLPPSLFPETPSTFNPLWRLPFAKPGWWSPEKGTIVGLLAGCIGGYGKYPFVQKAIARGKEAAEWTLTRIFARLIPLFVLGFIARMHQTNLLGQMTSRYAFLLAWLLLLLVGYMALLFLISSSGSLRRALQEAKNLTPA